MHIASIILCVNGLYIKQYSSIMHPQPIESNLTLFIFYNGQGFRFYRCCLGIWKLGVDLWSYCNIGIGGGNAIV